jgi:hypothetical protein
MTELFYLYGDVDPAPKSQYLKYRQALAISVSVRRRDEISGEKRF